MSSAVLVQTKGWERSFQPLMKPRILGHELADGGEGAAVDGLSFDEGEPDLDQVHPGGVGRGEVDDEPRVRLEPVADVLVLVGGVVVHHQVQLDRLTGLVVEDVAVGPLDLLEEGEELLVAVPRFQRGSDLAGGDIERGEQGRGPCR